MNLASRIISIQHFHGACMVESRGYEQTNHHHSILNETNSTQYIMLRKDIMFHVHHELEHMFV